MSSIGAMLDCELDSVTLSWQPSVGAVSYVAELTAAASHAARCTANQTNCVVNSLRCGEDYNVTVTAVGESCNSSTQMPRNVATGMSPSVAINLFLRWNEVRSRQTLKWQPVDTFNV